MVDWTSYLDSLCNAYAQWWTFGTLKDVVEPKRFEFDLMVQTVERGAQQKSKEEHKVERLSVLEGLRKYAPEHVILVGRPGSGKSTALVRLLVATAQQALQNPHSQIPVLLQLRNYNIYYKTSVLDLVQASLKRRRLRLNIETLEDLLAEGRFLLLMDGINELPDDEARRAIKEFRLDYSDVPMVFTTRDLGVGGDLGIEKKLEMQSLTEAEVEKFVRECMPGGSQQTLQQLRQRLRELGQTPFVMWMLYFIVQKTGTVPSGAGSAFREFTQLYERRSKEDAPVSDESRRWWSRLLEHLGFEMMQAEKPTDFRLTISKREAEDILTKVLDREKFDKPRDYALRWLEDLLKHHLVQVTSNDQIEFCHQLIQEYYAAGILLQMLLQKPSPLNDETLKREYLNYLKWTEPLALMLELLEDETQAVRVVKLALEVDVRLGARLAGEVKPAWQEQTVGLVAGLEIPQLLTIQLLGFTKSERVIPQLIKALENENANMRRSVVNAFVKIGSDATIPSLIQLLEDKDTFVASSASDALCRISSEATIPKLVQLLKHERSFVRSSAADALGNIRSEAAIEQLFKSLECADRFLCSSIAFSLSKTNSEHAVYKIIQLLQEEDYFVARSASEALSRISLKSALPELIKLLEHKNSFVRISAADTLGNIGSEAANSHLIEALKDEEEFVRGSTAIALGKIKAKEAIPKLIQLLENKYEDSLVRASVAKSLGIIGSDAAIPKLIQILENKYENHFLRSHAADALGKIGSEAIIPRLIKLLKDKEPDVRSGVAHALGEIGSTMSIFVLVKLLEDKVYTVRSSAAIALGEIGSETPIPNLIKLLEDGNPAVRRNAAEALGKIGSESAIPILVKLLEDPALDVSWKAAEALGKIGNSEVIDRLMKLLEHEGFITTTLENSLSWVTETLQTIQNRCKFYNYNLTRPIQPISTSLMHILHLSDLHFGTPDQANLWSNQLAEDLYNDLSIPHLDALILSGDIANYSTEEEYKAAQQFLHNLRQDFPLNPEQIILVPGNHDLNWKLAKKAYKLIDRDDYDGELFDGHYIEESASVIRVRDEGEYKQRFAHFSQFYETIKQKPYPLDYDQQATLDHLPEQNLLILGLNSAWQLDHHYKSRASIHMGALTNALTQIRRNPDYRNCLKIAVWHHPLDSAYSDRITDQGFLEQLAVNGFRFFLHGHIHKAETSLFRYDMSTNGRKLDRICAGTFGAPVREWVPGYPLQYNLLKIEDNQLTVYTRRREELNGAWKPDARWLQGAGKAPLDYYAISLLVP